MKAAAGGGGGGASRSRRASESGETPALGRLFTSGLCRQSYRRRSWLGPGAIALVTSATLTHGVRLDEEMEAKDFIDASDALQKINSMVDGLVESLAPGDDLDTVETVLRKALGDVDAAKKGSSNKAVLAAEKRSEAASAKAATAAFTKVTQEAAAIDARRIRAEEAARDAESAAKTAKKKQAVAEQLTAEAQARAEKAEAARAYAVEKEKVATLKLVPYKVAEDKAEKYAAQFQLKAKAAEDAAEKAKTSEEALRKANADSIARHQSLLKELAQAKEAETHANQRAARAEGKLKEIEELQIELGQANATLAQMREALDKCQGDLNQELKTSSDFKQSLLETKGKIAAAENARTDAEKHEVELVTDAGRSDSFKHLAQKELGICRDQEQEMRAQRDDARTELLTAKQAQIASETKASTLFANITKLERRLTQAKAAGCLMRSKGEECNQFHAGRDCASLSCSCDKSSMQCICD